MKLSIHLTIALVLLPLSVNAQGIKRDILGISLGTPLPEVASRKIIASAGDWTPPQEQLVPVGDYKCKKLGIPWRLSSGELSCKIEAHSHAGSTCRGLIEEGKEERDCHDGAEGTALPHAGFGDVAYNNAEPVYLRGTHWDWRAIPPRACRAFPPAIAPPTSRLI